MKKKQIIILSVIIALLVVYISVGSYAYFVAQVKGNDLAKQNVVTTGTMKLTFTDGPVINLENAIPGSSASKTFSLTNTGTLSTSYDLYFSNVINSFADPSDLVYSLVSSDGGYNTTSDVEVPTKSGKIISNYTIAPGVTQNYTLTITFLNKNENQDDNQGKVFSTTLSVNDMSDTAPYSAKYGVIAYTNGTLADNIPEKSSSYLVDKIECDNGANATWNYNDWGINILNTTKSGTTCNVYFVSGGPYSDGTGASIPELYQGLVPVRYDTNGNIVVANTTKEWYNYANHDWANAILVNTSDTTIKAKYFNDDMSINKSIIDQVVNMDDVLQMYVWIPRYKYLLWNANNGSSNPQAISITFESKETAKSSGTTNGTWLTHPAFTFGTTELNGIWVGKFENSGTISNLTIKPNVQSLTNLTVGDMFNATRNQELNYSAKYDINSSEIDTHMMKNMEWGSVAYLSSSIYGRYTDTSTCISSGCEVWINNVNTLASGSYGTSITGCSGVSVSASAANSMTACTSGYDWTTKGVNASTTGNQYGIYDMSGGTWEYVMGNMVDSSSNYYASSSGLTKPDNKYFDSYAYNTSNTTHARGKLGDTTKETLKTFGSTTGGWYSDYAYFPNNSYSWFIRGGYFGDSTNASVFSFNGISGNALEHVGFRSVFSAQ